MRHVDAVMCATDAATDALLLCACVRVRLSVYCVLAHCAGKPKRQPWKSTSGSSSSGSTSSSKWQVQGQLCWRTRQQQNRTVASLGHQLATLHSPSPPFLLLVQLYLYLQCCVCVCAAILCALFGLTFHFVLRLAFCGLPAAAVSYREFSHRFMASVYSIPQGDSISIRKPHTNCKQHNCVIWKGSFNFWISVLSLLKLCKYDARLRVHLTRQLRKCIIV